MTTPEEWYDLQTFGERGLPKLTAEEIIKKVAEIRAKNNEHWMKLLELAFKKSPLESKQILKNITDYDKEITKLWERLA